MNIDRFSLLLVCKQIRLEVLPIISSESFFQIKTYSLSRPALHRALKRAEPLCQQTKTVLLEIRDKAMILPPEVLLDLKENSPLSISSTLNELEANQLKNTTGAGSHFFELASVLKGYFRLKELILRLSAVHLQPSDILMLLPFFQVASRGVTLSFELWDYKPDFWDDHDHIRVKHSKIDNGIYRLGRHVSGPQAEVRCSRSDEISLISQRSGLTGINCQTRSRLRSIEASRISALGYFFDRSNCQDTSYRYNCRHRLQGRSWAIV